MPTTTTTKRLLMGFLPAALCLSAPCLAALFLAATAGNVLAAGLEELDRDEVRDRVEAILSDGDYQTELPVVEDDPPEMSVGGAGLLLLVLFWLAVGLVVVVVVALMVNWAAGRFGPRGRKGVRAPVIVQATLSEAPLADAETLARGGNFSEAVHVLLLRTIAELREHLEYAAHPALTSREIQVDAPLDEAAHGALRGLVTEVELSHFGGRLVDELQYRRCVGHFQALQSFYGAAR